MSVRIITDSTVDVPEQARRKMQAVPLTIHFGSEELIDGVTIDKRQFYEKLAASEDLPTTSQATPAAFGAVFDELTRAGDSAVVITIASELSGTYQSACIAAADYPEVFVVDSTTAAVGSGILAQLALRLAEQGMSAREIAAVLTEKRSDIRVFALLDTLEYLKRGGRISKTVAFAGGLLHIKPVISVQDGAVTLVGKARGAKQGSQLLTEKIEESGGIDFSLPVLLAYSGVSGENLEKYVEESHDYWQGRADGLDRVMLCSVIGTHTGPGVTGLAYFTKN